MKKSFLKLNNKAAFTLIEMLIYISLMVIITLVVTQSIITVLKSNRASFADINIRNSGYSAIEAILREVRSSESIDQASDNILQMTKSSGSVVRFATSSDSTLNFYEGAGTPVLVGPLTSKNILVKNLNFIKIDTGKSLAVKIEIELETTVNGITKNEWFYNTAILRGSY